MTIFCPSCGTKNDKEISFCRNCGDELPKIKDKLQLGDFRNKIRNLNTSNYILTLVASLLTTIFGIYLTMNDIGGDLFPIAFLAVSIILIASSMLSIYGNYYLKKTDLKIATKDSENTLDASTSELLPEADFENYVQASVTENTTRKLEKEKIERKNI